MSNDIHAFFQSIYKIFYVHFDEKSEFLYLDKVFQILFLFLFNCFFAFQFFSINVFKEKFVNLFACFSSFKACSWLVNSLTTSM